MQTLTHGAQATLVEWHGFYSVQSCLQPDHDFSLGQGVINPSSARQVIKKLTLERRPNDVKLPIEMFKGVCKTAESQKPTKQGKKVRKAHDLFPETMNPSDGRLLLSSRSKFTLQSPGISSSVPKTELPRKQSGSKKRKENDSKRKEPPEGLVLMHHGSTPNLYQHVKPRYLESAQKSPLHLNIDLHKLSPLSKKGEGLLAPSDFNMTRKSSSKKSKSSLQFGKKTSVHLIQPLEVCEVASAGDGILKSEQIQDNNDKKTLASELVPTTQHGHKESTSGVSVGAPHKQLSPSIQLLYYKAIDKYLIREQLKMKAEAVKEAQELKECTFKPALRHRSKSSKHIPTFQDQFVTSAVVSSKQIDHWKSARSENEADELVQQNKAIGELRHSQPTFAGSREDLRDSQLAGRSKSPVVISEKRKQELHAFYQQQVSWDQERRDKLAKLRDERVETEKASCTFTPSILESSFDGMDWRAIHEKIKGTYERQMRWLEEVNHDKEYLRQSLYDSVGKLPLLYYYRGEDTASGHSQALLRSFVKKEFQTTETESQLARTQEGREYMNSSSATGHGNLTQIMDPETILRFEIQDAFKIVKSLDKLIATNSFKK